MSNEVVAVKANGNGSGRKPILSTPSWIALIVGILMACVGAVFVANAESVSRTVATDQQAIQEIKVSDGRQDEILQTLAQTVAAQSANINNLTESVRSLTTLVQNHLIGGGK